MWKKILTNCRLRAKKKKEKKMLTPKKESIYGNENTLLINEVPMQGKM